MLLDEPVRARLAAAAEALRPHAPDVAWIARDNLHLTLKFLGAVRAEMLDGLVAVLAGAAAAIRPFDLEVRGLGAFPSAGRPRVLWAGVGAGGAEAAALAAAIDAALAPIGFAPEPRPFTTHVTLGRVRVPRAQPGLATALNAGVLGRQRVEAASLMRSELSSRGARYTELARLALRGPLEGRPEVSHASG